MRARSQPLVRRRRAALVPRSLRGRLRLALLVLAAVVLLALDAVIYSAVHGYLLDRTDTTLRAVRDRLVQEMPDAQRPAQGVPGYARMPLTPEYFLQIRRPGRKKEPLLPGLRSHYDPPPALPDRLGQLLLRPDTLPAEESGGPDYRVLAGQFPHRRDTLIVAVPLKELDATLRRLLLIETAATAGCLALLVGAGSLILRRGLRPLEFLARDADAIAAGDGAHRVQSAHGEGEVGRLGLALNTMLEEQDATQRRLRQFIADVSHELRTPITAVLGYADLHQQGALEGAAQREKAMARITSEALRMRRLVDDLLLLTRLDMVRQPDRKHVDVAEVARAAVAAALVVEPERPLTVDVAATAGSEGLDLVVEGDSDQLRRVVDNLLANVRVHTPPGTPARVLVGAKDDDAVVVEVSDEGPGIPAESLPNVLDRFYRADRARSGDGSGLGLAIVAAVASAHGGRVDVSSALGEGTAVRVELPRRQRPPRQRDTSS